MDRKFSQNSPNRILFFFRFANAMSVTGAETIIAVSVKTERVNEISVSGKPDYMKPSFDCLSQLD
jgi:hypothetical protein